MTNSELSWVVLTQGDRPDALTAALRSIRQASPDGEIVVVLNGHNASLPDGLDDDLGTIRTVQLGRNEGVPGGRHAGLMETSGAIVAFLDDDAEVASSHASERILQEFAVDRRLAAISCRLIDEFGLTSRRHVPRVGSQGEDVAGEVVTFLGGASAVRRSAYDAVGGYWAELFYSHEELELSWRLIDADFRIRYVPDIEVLHPRTEVGRHPQGWYLTGRNRVWIARRTLPWPIAVGHTVSWLILGVVRAPDRRCRTRYLSGWSSGWKTSVTHRPIKWTTVWRLARLGRIPLW